MKTYLALIMIFSFIHSILTAEPIAIGTAAPEVVSLDDKGEKIDLGKELSSGTVLVFFYPKALTPGCTKQACSLRDNWDELQSRDVKIFGVSVDKAETQAEFKNKHSLPFTLIADTDGAVSKAFGKSLRSRHAYIFIDGKLAWSDHSAATKKQGEEVLAALDALKK